MDVLQDVAERLAAAGVDKATIKQVITETRKDWEGERTYIGRIPEYARDYVAQRNAALIADWRAGERVPLLARRYGISEKRVYAILKMYV